jgi:hypothetical protein
MAIQPTQQGGAGRLGANPTTIAADQPWRVVGSFGNQASATEGTGQRNQQVNPEPGCQAVAGGSVGWRLGGDLRCCWAKAMGTAVAQSIGGRHAKGQGQGQDGPHQHGPGADGVRPPLGVMEISPRPATAAAAETPLHLGNQAFTAVGARHRSITLGRENLPKRAGFNCSNQTNCRHQPGSRQPPHPQRERL